MFGGKATLILAGILMLAIILVSYSGDDNNKNSANINLTSISALEPSINPALISKTKTDPKEQNKEPSISHKIGLGILVLSVIALLFGSRFSSMSKNYGRFTRFKE